jgi:hypothetical protein
MYLAEDGGAMLARKDKMVCETETELGEGGSSDRKANDLVVVRHFLGLRF